MIFLNYSIQYSVYCLLYSVKKKKKIKLCIIYRGKWNNLYLAPKKISKIDN